MGDFAVRGWRFLVRVLIGAGCGIVGMLPWLVHGARLTLQNLWATPTVNPADMPIVLLPFSQYQLDLVAAVIVVGWAIAGATARVLAARDGRHTRTAITLGVLAAQLVALVQTAAPVAAGLRHPGDTVRLVDDSLAYLVIVIAWIVVTIVIGWLVFVLMTRPALSAFVIGTGIAAVVLEAWIRGFIAPITAAAASAGDVGLFIAHWAPAVIVGAVIGWAGVGSARRMLAAIAALALLWLGSAAAIAATSTAGSRALARLPGELVDYFGLLFVSELRHEALALVLVAAGFAVVCVGIRWSVSRRTIAFAR